MATYWGTEKDDTVTGALYEANDFEGFGIGRDTVTGGQADDTFVLYADATTDCIDGSKGRDLVDYSPSDVALRISLTTGTSDTGHVLATFDGSNWVDVADLHSIEDVIGSSYSDHIYGRTPTTRSTAGPATTSLRDMAGTMC